MQRILAVACLAALLVAGCTSTPAQAPLERLPDDPPPQGQGPLNVSRLTGYVRGLVPPAGEGAWYEVVVCTHPDTLPPGQEEACQTLCVAHDLAFARALVQVSLVRTDTPRAVTVYTDLRHGCETVFAAEGPNGLVG